MSSLIRALLVWLLVLAVPTQAAAAVTMAFCGPNHHDRGAAAPVQQAAATGHTHHGSVLSHEHEHGQVAVQPDEGGSAFLEAPSASTSADASNHKCSACASCCSAAAIFDSVPAVSAAAVGPTVFPAFEPSVEPSAVAGPERPPRIVLA